MWDSLNVHHRWMDRQHVVCRIHTVQFLDEKQSSDTCRQETLNERKQPDSKHYILCDSICVRFLKKAEDGSQSVVAFARGRTEDCLQRGRREILGCCRYSGIDGDGVCVCCRFSCVQLFDSMNCSPPDSFVHGILQAKILKSVAISFSRGSSWPRDQTHISWVSCIGRWVLYHFVTWEAWAWWLHKYKFTETHWTVYLKWINSLGNGAVKIYLTDCSWQNPFAFAVSCGSER